MPLLNRETGIKLDINTELAEKTIMREMVKKVLMKVTCSLTLESRLHGTWVARNFVQTDGVQADHIGIGCNLSTWYGSPDASRKRSRELMC